MKDKIRNKFLSTRKKLSAMKSGAKQFGLGLFVPIKIIPVTYPSTSYPELTQEEIKSLPF